MQKPSAYYFYAKSKISLDFHICISVSLTETSKLEYFWVFSIWITVLTNEVASGVCWNPNYFVGKSCLFKSLNYKLKFKLILYLQRFSAREYLKYAKKGHFSNLNIEACLPMFPKKNSKSQLNILNLLFAASDKFMIKFHPYQLFQNFQDPLVQWRIPVWHNKHSPISGSPPLHSFREVAC